MNGRVAAAVLAFGLAATVAAEEIVTIALRHRLAEEVAAALTPLLEPGETVVPSRGLLIVKARGDRLDELRSVVAQLDQKARRLLITVAQGRGLTREGLAAGIGGTAGTDTRLQGHLYQTEDRGSGRQTQRVQTLDGQAALIRFGQEIQLPAQSQIGYGPGGAVVAGQSAYSVDATTGFAVTPKLAGDQVTLYLAPWSNRLSRRGDGSLDTLSAETTLRTRLGEWVEVGGQVDVNTLEQSTLTGHGYGTRTEAHRIYLRVDDLDGNNP